MIIFIEMFFVSLLILMVYWRVALKLGITDHPNNRSSHIKVTVTGAGFIFPLFFLIPLLITGTYVHFRALLTGLFLLTVISFLDDLSAMKKLPRIIIQTLAVALLLWQTGGLFHMTIITLVPAFIFVVGIINAYNFMDGINGITAFYSLATVSTLFYLSKHGYTRLPREEVFIFLLAALSAFSCMNARRKALVFCGDVGSITLAFIFSFMIIQMMIMDDSGKWILLIGIYGLDSVATISLRLFRGEDISEPHKSHFYQYLVNERKIQHFYVSLGYTIIQVLVNIVLITSIIRITVLVYILIVVIYIILRISLEGRKRLLKK